MSPRTRGPSGAAFPPPPWLGSARLPLLRLLASAPLARIHRLGHDPVFFSPGPGNPPLGRFDSASGAFGVLYVAQSFAGALAETVLRNPQRQLVDLSAIAGRALSVLRPSRPLRLVAMHGAGLQALGTDNAVSTGPYAPCGAWTDALAAHRQRPDGIAYGSRHDPDQLCIAVFDRLGLTLEIVEGPTPLVDMLPDVSAVLRRYDKGLA